MQVGEHGRFFLNSPNTTEQAGDIGFVPISSVIKKAYLWVRVEETSINLYEINATFIQLTLLWLFLILHTGICTGSMLSRVHTRPEKLVQTPGAELYRSTDE